MKRKEDQSGKFRPNITLSNQEGVAGADIEALLVDFREVTVKGEKECIATIKLTKFANLPPQGEEYYKLRKELIRIKVIKTTTPEQIKALEASMDEAARQAECQVGEEYDLWVGSQLLYKFIANKIVNKEHEPSDAFDTAKTAGFWLTYEGKKEITSGEWEGTLAHQWSMGLGE